MTARFSTLSTICGLLLPVILLGCGSAQKQRLEQRDKLAASSGLYCEFISGDVHSDIDVELNMQLARRCEPTKPLTITNYKNSSENYGVIYCCSIKKDEKKAGVHSTPAPVTAAAPKKADDELDLSEDAAGTPEKPTEKPTVAPKVAPSNPNNPAAPANKPGAAATAPAAAKPAAAPPASAASKSASPAAPSSAANKPASAPATSSSSSAPASAKPTSSTSPQSAAPKAPAKTPDALDADILGE